MIDENDTSIFDGELNQDELKKFNSQRMKQLDEFENNLRKQSAPDDFRNTFQQFSDKLNTPGLFFNEGDLLLQKQLLKESFEVIRASINLHGKTGIIQLDGFVKSLIRLKKGNEDIFSDYFSELDKTETNYNIEDLTIPNEVYKILHEGIRNGIELYIDYNLEELEKKNTIELIKQYQVTKYLNFTETKKEKNTLENCINKFDLDELLSILKRKNIINESNKWQGIFDNRIPDNDQDKPIVFTVFMMVCKPLLREGVSDISAREIHRIFTTFFKNTSFKENNLKQMKKKDTKITKYLSAFYFLKDHFPQIKNNFPISYNL